MNKHGEHLGGGTCPTPQVLRASSIAAWARGAHTTLRTRHVNGMAAKPMRLDAVCVGSKLAWHPTGAKDKQHKHIISASAGVHCALHIQAGLCWL